MSEGDRRADLGLCRTERKRQREESSAHDQGRPLRSHERSPVRIGQEDQQPFRVLPDESESEQAGADSEKHPARNFGRERRERESQKNCRQRVGNGSRRSVGVRISSG